MDPIILSVALFNYNQGEYLSERLEAIFNQLPLHSEIVVLDDASTDHSMDILQKINQKYPQIRLFQNKENLGVEKTANKIITLCRGVYVAPLAVDDIILPGCIEKMLTALLANPEFTFCSSEFAVLNLSESYPSVGQLYVDHPFSKKQPCFLLTCDKVGEIMMKGSLPCGSSIMMKKEIWGKYGGFKKELGSDWYFSRIVPLCEGTIFIPQVLHIWRNTISSHGRTFWAKQTKKKMLFSIFAHLSRPENRHIRERVLKFQILYPLCKEFFWELFRCPRDYDFLKQVLMKKMERLFSKLKKILT